MLAVSSIVFDGMYSCLQAVSGTSVARDAIRHDTTRYDTIRGCLPVGDDEDSAPCNAVCRRPTSSGSR